MKNFTSEWLKKIDFNKEGFLKGQNQKRFFSRMEIESEIKNGENIDFAIIGLEKRSNKEVYFSLDELMNLSDELIKFITENKFAIEITIDCERYFYFAVKPNVIAAFTVSAKKKKSSSENGKLGGRPVAADSKLWVLTADGKCGEYYTNFSGDISLDRNQAMTFRTKSEALDAQMKLSDEYGIGYDLIGVSQICDIEAVK